MTIWSPSVNVVHNCGSWTCSVRVSWSKVPWNASWNAVSSWNSSIYPFVIKSARIRYPSGCVNTDVHSNAVIHQWPVRTSLGNFPSLAFVNKSCSMSKISSVPFLSAGFWTGGCSEAQQCARLDFVSSSMDSVKLRWLLCLRGLCSLPLKRERTGRDSFVCCHRLWISLLSISLGVH